MNFRKSKPLFAFDKNTSKVTQQLFSLAVCNYFNVITIIITNNQVFFASNHNNIIRMEILVYAKVVDVCHKEKHISRALAI